MVLTSGPLAANRPITLKVDQFGEFLGELAWHDGQRYGLCFRDPEQLATESASDRSSARKIIGLDPF